MRRRTVISAGAAAGLLSLAWWKRDDGVRQLLPRDDNRVMGPLPALALDDRNCVETAPQIEGPFFLRAPVRRDIRERIAGLPLTLTLGIVNMRNCAPLSDVTVEIWHCDPAGRYSGYDELAGLGPFDTLATLALTQRNGHVRPDNNQRFLRGAQISDAWGRVSFETVFPGWYEPRVPHIHVKVMRGNAALLTTQLYFPDGLVSDIYARHPAYKPRGASPYTIGNDVVLRHAPGAPGLLIEPVRTLTGLNAAIKIAIA